MEVAWFTAEDERRRPLPLRRVLLPWAAVEQIGIEKGVERSIPEIAGGNWLHGKRIFFGERAACSKCHAMGSQGGKAGPDLSNLIYRDYASVMKDITQPNAAINPDHVAYNVGLIDGESFVGILTSSSGAEMKFVDASGKTSSVPTNRIAVIKPSPISLMPEGLLEVLSGQERKDLLTYLLMPPPLSPATMERAGEPPPRAVAEVEAVLNSGNRTSPPDAVRPLRIVLCAGPKDHGPGEHDYPVWQQRWLKLLSLADEVSVEAADKWPTPEQLSKAGVIVFYSNNPGWSLDRAKELDAFLNRGGGLVYIHFAVDGHEQCDELAQRIGLAWRGGVSKFRHGPIDLKFEPHPITQGFRETHLEDESYWNLTGSEKNIQMLARAVEESQMQPLIWAREQGKGRVFVSIPGHFTWTFDDPLFRLLILRGIAWSGRQPLNRFNDLATIGARVNQR